MGSAPGRTPITTFYTDKSYIDGRYGEAGNVYVVVNDCAKFSCFGAEHEFILMEDKHWKQYKIYEWTVNNLKMYACAAVKFRKKEYLGRFKVSSIFNAAVDASIGKEFNTLTYNCKDWVKTVKAILHFKMLICKQKKKEIEFSSSSSSSDEIERRERKKKEERRERKKKEERRMKRFVKKYIK
jgi:hypothetical protein